MRRCGAVAAGSAGSFARRSLQAPCSVSLAHRNKTAAVIALNIAFPCFDAPSSMEPPHAPLVGMTGLLERRVASAAVFGKNRLRFQRPSAR